MTAENAQNARQNADGINCQVCGKLSGIRGMGFCFSCAESGPEWAQHESMAWLEHSIAKRLIKDIENRKDWEKENLKKQKKSKKLEIFYY